MNSFQTSTGPIAYDVRGEGHPLVLLPSGGHDLHDYDALRDLLPSRYRSIALDWPAHGSSAAGEGAATEGRFADITEEFVAALAPDGAVVIGNSVGGYAAARLAIRRPELVKGLVLIDGGGFEPSTVRGRVFCALMARRWFLRRFYPSFSASYMHAQTDADRGSRARAIQTTRRDPGLRALTELWHSFTLPEHNLHSLAHEITAPTLLLWGRHDPVFPPAVAERARDAIPNATLFVLDTGHVPHTTDPVGVARHLVPFADAIFEARVHERVVAPQDEGSRRAS